MSGSNLHTCSKAALGRAVFGPCAACELEGSVDRFTAGLNSGICGFPVRVDASIPRDEIRLEGAGGALVRAINVSPLAKRLPIKTPYHFDNFSGRYFCNGCGEASGKDGKPGYDLHPEFRYTMVPKDFEHLEGCIVKEFEATSVGEPKA